MRRREDIENTCRKNRRGAVMVEFALGYGFVLLILAGVIEFGDSCYVYNPLQSTMRAAARDASVRPYDGCLVNQGGGTPNNCDQGEEWEEAVKNMAVYGDPVISSGIPLVPDLTVARVTVSNDASDNESPKEVAVQLDGFVVNTFFARFTFNGKPKATFPYMGRAYLP